MIRPNEISPIDGRLTRLASYRRVRDAYIHGVLTEAQMRRLIRGVAHQPSPVHTTPSRIEALLLKSVYRTAAERKGK